MRSEIYIKWRNSTKNQRCFPISKCLCISNSAEKLKNLTQKFLKECHGLLKERKTVAVQKWHQEAMVTHHRLCPHK